MTSPVSAIEATNPADRIWAYTNSRGSRVWTPMKPVIVGAHEEQEYVLADIHNALARQAEALQRENAELREALEAFAAIADQLPIPSVGVPDHKPLWGYDGVELSYGDFRRARALLGGSDAGN